MHLKLPYLTEFCYLALFTIIFWIRTYLTYINAKMEWVNATEIWQLTLNLISTMDFVVTIPKCKYNWARPTIKLYFSVHWIISGFTSNNMQSIWLSDFHPGNLWATVFGFRMIGYQVNVWQICNLLWLLYYPLMKTGSTLWKIMQQQNME